jgi:amino acid adenylation domain-containing protein/non-ribosomal peptide synthase protein (TIGR01720 family)
MSTTDLAAKRAALSDAKRALLQARLRGKEPAAAPQRPVVTRMAGPGPVHPLSFGQERMWFLCQYDPDLPIYNVPIANLVSTTIDVGALERAATEVVRRHESLRTVFRMVDSHPRQVVLDPFPVRVEIVDVRDRVGSDFKSGVRRAVEREGARPFNLATGPLFRITLLQVSDDSYAMVVNTHHIATDGWAYPIILGELDEFYGDFMAGRTPDLPPPALRYADYAAWERQHLTGETLDAHVRFWRQHLAGANDTEIAGDRPRPPQQSFRGAFHHFQVPLRITDAARAVGRQQSATVNMVLMAALELLLSRYTDSTDITVGTLLGNRQRAELEQVVGFFVNTAAVRVDLGGDPTFRQLVDRCKRMILDVGEHQEIPFERVVDALGGPRDPGRQPLFQIMYFHHVYSHAYRQRIHRDEDVHRLDPRPIYDNDLALIDTGAAQFDLTMVTLEMPEGLDCMLEYATDLFDPPSMQAFARRYERLLARATANPDVPVSRLSIMDDEEEARVVREWAATPAPGEVAGSVLTDLRQRAAEAPDAPAIVTEGVALSRAGMMARVDGLAARLRALGVSPEARVGVCMGRGSDLWVAALAVMRAGGVYVPLDPELPAERMAYLLDDSAAVAVLVQPGTAERIPSGGARVVMVDPAESFDAPDPASLPDPAPQSAAYVIYTSGSTGRPKGVVVSHASLAGLAAGIRQAYGLGPDDRVLQFASTSFDASLEEVFPTLASGGSIVVRTDAMPTSGTQFIRWVEEQGITLLNFPTAFWHEWVRELDERGMQPPRTVRLVTMGGERARQDRQAAWDRVASGIVCVNGYGPTETTVTATLHTTVPGADPRMEVPIGRAVPGWATYVLDSRGQPVAPGVPGELFLGGTGVARGYLGRPALTAEKFVPDPFSGVPGARLYRTGDRVKWRLDGALEFMGRLDDQVKVRGFRIEPGEIEAALRTHPSVNEAAVVAREDARGQRRLVAYVAGAAPADAAELRMHLRERLPEHMVPAVFVPLDALPLNISGKVDRRALPDPETPADAPTAAYEAPRGDVEETLARLWAEALGRERVGVHENFFEMGGDSILSILVIGRAAEHGIRLTPRQVFLHPTIAELATVAGTAAPVQAEQGPVTGPAPLTPAARWFFDGDPVDPHHWNHAVYLTLPAGTAPAAVAAGLDDLLAHHDALRLRFRREGDGWQSSFAEPGGPTPLETVDLSGIADVALDAAIQPHADRAHASLDLEHGPLARAVFFDLGGGRAPRLLLVVHHLVVDAVSWAVVTEDFETAVRDRSLGVAPALPAKTTSFKAWAERLAEHAGAPETLREADFWRAAVPADAPALPVDDPAAPDTEELARAIGVELDEAETDRLLREATAAYGVRADELLLAGLLRAVQAWSGQDAVMVELEGHGREDLFDGVDLSRTVGWFTATYPLHLAAPRAADPGETLKAVKETVRAVPARGLGWGVLRWLGPDDVRASLAALPWPELSFNYLGQQGMGAGEGGGGFEPAGAAPGTARSPRARRRERISIDALVMGGRLHVALYYGGRAYRPETMQRLAEAYEQALRDLAAHCTAEGAGAFTPSDFPEAGLDQGSLDALFAQLGGLE